VKLPTEEGSIILLRMFEHTYPVLLVNPWLNDHPPKWYEAGEEQEVNPDDYELVEIIRVGWGD
jgi:hypothetical protein